MTQNTFKSYSLFNDIEDNNLRNRNRAVVLTNMAEDHIDRKSKKVSIKGANLLLGYFNEILMADREDVQTRFAENMALRGFKLA